MRTTMANFGFQQIADITYQFQCGLWWHPGDLFQVQVVDLDPYRLVKGIKSYFMVGISEKGQTYARDLNNLHQWLETRMPEFHISVSGYRDVTPSMVLRKLGNRPMDLEPIKGKLEALQTNLSETAILGKYADVSKGVIQEMQTQTKREIEALKLESQKAAIHNQNISKMTREFNRKGNATGYLFSYSTNLQSAYGNDEFHDAISMIIKEVQDIHKFEIKQRLEGGRLQIYIDEVRHPDLAFQIEWAGGFLNPRQLGSEFSDLKERVEEALMVHPFSDILIDGHVKDEKNLFRSKALQGFLMNMDSVEAPTDIPELPQEGGYIGNLMQGNQITNHPVFLPVTQHHGYSSGTTGAGKSYTTRVLVENALIERVNVLILDRTLQWAGLGLPNRDPGVMERFDELGIERERARGFRIKLHSPPLPKPQELTTGCNVVSFKQVPKDEQCKQTAEILKYIYETYIERGDETKKVKLLIVLEEAKTFLNNKDVRQYLDWIGREGRKYGIILLIVTQKLSDFKYEVGSIREMVQVRCFMKATDSIERDYASNTLGKKAQSIRDLNTGEAMVNAPGIKAVKVFIRPPFSQVEEPTEAEIREINGQSDIEIIGYSKAPDVDETEAKILDFVKEVYEFSKGPVMASDIEKKLDLTNSTCHRVLTRMIERKLVKKEFVNTGSGRPKLGIKYIPGVR